MVGIEIIHIKFIASNADWNFSKQQLNGDRVKKTTKISNSEVVVIESKKCEKLYDSMRDVKFRTKLCCSSENIQNTCLLDAWISYVLKIICQRSLMHHTKFLRQIQQGLSWSCMIPAWRLCFLAWSLWFLAWSWYDYHVFYVSYHDLDVIIIFSMLFFEETFFCHFL